MKIVQNIFLYFIILIVLISYSYNKNLGVPIVESQVAKAIYTCNKRYLTNNDNTIIIDNKGNIYGFKGIFYAGPYMKMKVFKSDKTYIVCIGSNRNCKTTRTLSIKGI